MNNQAMVKVDYQREQDNQHTSFERGSLFQRHFDGYYFSTREGMEFGPYSSLEQAQQARELFVHAVSGDLNALKSASAELLQVEEIDYCVSPRQCWAA